jgi:hypothetical protein
MFFPHSRIESFTGMKRRGKAIIYFKVGAEKRYILNRMVPNIYPD